MSDLLLILLAATLGPVLLYALVCFIWYKFRPQAYSEKCKIVRESDAFTIYDDVFPRKLNPIGHIYIKNNKAELHIRKTFDEDDVVEYEPIESWVANDEVFKGYMVGVTGVDESAGKLSFETIKDWFHAFFSRYDYKGTIEKPVSDEELAVPDEIDLDPEDGIDAPHNSVELKHDNKKTYEIREFGRLKKDIEKVMPMRKMLCGYLAIKEDIRRRLDTTIADGDHSRMKPKWKETSYLAILIFTIIYSLYIVFFPAPEDLCPKKFLPYLFVAIVVVIFIWIILHEIHVELSLKNNKFTQFLRLFNRCTGMRTSIIIFYIFWFIGLYFSYVHYHMLYLEYYLAVLLVLRLSQSEFNSNLWKVDDPLLPMLRQNEIDDNKVDDGAEDPNPNPMLFAINHYDWTISGLNANNKVLLQLKFDKSEMARLTNNYDNSELLNSDGDPADVARYYVEAEKDSLHMKKIRWFVDNTTIGKGLTSVQKMQLILDFVQDRESFERVEESLTSGRLRSAEEILYSKKATAMDRAVLASTIYATMGYKVNILQARDGRVALEVAESENVCKDLCGVIRNDVFSYNDAVYYVCDMQADGFVIGTIPSFKKSDFIRRIVIA